MRLVGTPIIFGGCIIRWGLLVDVGSPGADVTGDECAGGPCAGGPCARGPCARGPCAKGRAVAVETL